MLNQMLQPFTYLAISHPHKWKVDWLFPILISLACTFLSLDAEWRTELFRSSGPVYLLLGFLQCLPGFYIAALAAIATFGRTDIDNVLPEPTPTVKLSSRGENILVKLTRRRFLAMLFAFLTCESILLVLLSVFGVSFGDTINELAIFGADWGRFAGGLLVFVYFTLLAQLLIATFWGLYYLGFKLHETQ